MRSEEVPIDRVRWLRYQVRFKLVCTYVPSRPVGVIMLVHNFTHPVQRPSMAALDTALGFRGANA